MWTIFDVLTSVTHLHLIKERLVTNT